MRFFKHFSSYLFHAKKRQRPLGLALVGLFLSSFALLTLQSTMGGLQHKLVQRSKDVSGHYTLTFTQIIEVTDQQKAAIKQELKDKDLTFYWELETEGLAKGRGMITPVIIHGLENKRGDEGAPRVLQGFSLSQAIVPYDLAKKLEVRNGNQFLFISPTATDYSFDEIPRFVSSEVGNIIFTDVPEIDANHLWVRIGVVQNLIKARGVNKVRFFSNKSIDANDANEIQILFQKIFPEQNFHLVSWEQENGTLVWALRLESSVMVFLFAAMTSLVSLAITSGSMIFFDRIKGDLASFWILGQSKKKLERSLSILLYGMGISSVLLGLVTSGLVLTLLDRYGVEILPAIFVDRKIPVHITWEAIGISTAIPLFIGAAMFFWAIKEFKENHDFNEYLRGKSF